MIFLVLLGADLLNSGLALTQMPNELAEWVKNSGLAPMLVLFAILILYLLLGCVMDSLAMILLTIPALVRGRLSRVQGVALLCIYAAFCAVQFTL